MFITERGLTRDQESIRAHPASTTPDQAHGRSHRTPIRKGCGAPVLTAEAPSAGCSQGVRLWA